MMPQIDEREPEGGCWSQSAHRDAFAHLARYSFVREASIGEEF